MKDDLAVQEPEMQILRNPSISDSKELLEFIEQVIVSLRFVQDDTAGAAAIARELGYGTVAALLGKVSWGIASAKVPACDAKKELLKISDDKEPWGLVRVTDD